MPFYSRQESWLFITFQYTSLRDLRHIEAGYTKRGSSFAEFSPSPYYDSSAQWTIPVTRVSMEEGRFDKHIASAHAPLIYD